MKKNSRFLLVMIAGLYAISGTVSLQAAEMQIQEIEMEYAPPVLSIAQVRALKNNFVSWLGKHYRCLYAGKCTRAEKAQVTAEWSRWIKRLGFTVVVGLALYFGKPKAQQAAQHVSQQMQKMHPAVVIAAVLDELLAQPGDAPGQPLDATERRERLLQFIGDVTEAPVIRLAQVLAPQFNQLVIQTQVRTDITPQEQKDLIRDQMTPSILAEFRTVLGMEQDQPLPDWITEGLIEKVFQKLESRELQLPGWQKVRLVPTGRPVRQAAAPESAAAESAEGSYPEEEEEYFGAIQFYRAGSPFSMSGLD